MKLPGGVGDTAQAGMSSHTRERLGHLLDTSTRTGPAFAAALIVLTVAAAWLGTYAAGGTKSVLPQMFYLPIIFAAGRFGWVGAAATAGLSGIVTGPLMPLDVAAGLAQTPEAWVARLVAFLTVGVVVAWLTGESRVSVIDFARDARAARVLLRGLERGDFTVHYQPVVDLSTGRTTGFEALCRWDGEALGAASPSVFIPLAERTGTVGPIGRFVLREALRQGAAWQGDGCDVVMAVNVSAHQLSEPDLFSQVRTTLLDAGLRPASLCIEITETAIVRDRPTALGHVRALHDLGVTIALDDFGSGHASLAYLLDFPIDILKIDVAFVSTVDSDARSAALVSGIVQLARALGAKTIAEGIERPEQLDTLRAMGCDYGQGYLLGRPGPAPSGSALLASDRPAAM
ncbi:MAG: hypothetical protein BGO38_08915 [Cellulomonas sp. 73-145]|uniref:EAL domain-containing protein n=1 Tax=Cellulomonas sp. 73-145 TaxID=1895739 RepID=UPI0009269074|nr:EAL domain-containing protein [Cellulomonas sp. 73-145]MBN9325710.1 EAL domain-containing protein [Cellulomonas sp.]OJV60854.1 MAG: hypothetical protein BGO38_08915 [Cellulomonas sp. 73-145]